LLYLIKFPAVYYLYLI